MCDNCTRAAMLPLVTALGVAAVHAPLDAPTEGMRQVLHAMTPPETEPYPSDPVEIARWKRIRAENVETSITATQAIYGAISTEDLLTISRAASELTRVFRVIEKNADYRLGERAEAGDATALGSMAQVPNVEMHVLDLSGLNFAAMFGRKPSETPQAPH